MLIMENKITSFFTSYKLRNFSFLILSIVIFLISKNNGMFWDNVLFASKMGNHLFDNGILNWTIPNEFDPGHPPFLGFLLAIFWKIFGHKLWVSHLLMLPFTFGIFYQLFKFISYFIKNKKFKILAFLLVLLDPTLSTQFVIVNPELLLVFFFLVSINGILYKKRFLKFIGLFFLSIVSFRGMMLFTGLLLFEILNKIYIKKEQIKTIFTLNFLSIYIIGSLPGICFVVWRLLTKGWIQTHADSPWAGLWHIATPKIFLKNSILLIWRYLDFGRVFIFIFLIICFVTYGKKILKSEKNEQLLLISISSVFFIIIVSLFATNTFGHRYFIVSFICFILLGFKILIDFFSNKKMVYIILLIGLVSGNLWIYPKHISQGWDATLAHLPYHSLRIEAIQYLDKNNIKLNEVSSFFPNYNSLDLIDLNQDFRSFSKFNGKNKYALDASVYNLSDEDLNILQNNYTILKQFNNFNINIKIYILKTS